MPNTPPTPGAVKPGALVVERNGVPTVVYEPLPHQVRFHASRKRFCLLEGGRGSGKSKALRFDAYMKCLSIPRFNALIVRRSFPELKNSHLVQLPFEVQALGLPADAWHSTNFTLRFPNHSTLRFGHVEDEAALTKLLSTEYEWIGADELATFTHRMFAFLCTSLRSAIPHYLPVFRGCTNPVGVGAGWVKTFFLDQTPDPEEFPDYSPGDYEAIHADLDDNPYVNPSEYAKLFAQLPSKALRDALRHGIWAVEGQFFTEWQEKTPDGAPWHVLDRLPTMRGVPLLDVPHLEIVRVVDWGYAASGSPGLCLWFAILPDGTAIGVREYYFRETLPADAAAEILRRSVGMKVRYTVGDTQMWAEHEGPSIAEHFARAGVSMIEADKQREPGWIELHNWLRTPVSNGVVTRPKLSFWREGCPRTIRTFPTMVVDPRNPMDMQSVGVEDEGADCARYFVMSRPAAAREARPDPALAWIYRAAAKVRRAATDPIGAEARHR